MNCDLLAGGVIELARDPDATGSDARMAAEHVASCADCRARLARQRELTAGLRALAASAIPDAGHESRETALLAAFRERQRRPAAAVPPRGGVRGRRAMAAAAAILVAASLSLLVWPREGHRSRGTSADSGRAWRERPARPADPRPPAVAPSNHAAAAPDVRRPPKGPRAARPAPPAARRPVQVVEFTPLPGAAGLPELESGRILRVEVPAAVLPVYGLDVVPDASAPVPLDMLIGQDGQPRAVRLAGANADQRSRR